MLGIRHREESHGLVNKEIQGRDKADKEKDTCNTAGYIPRRGLESLLQVMSLSLDLTHINTEATVITFLDKGK